LFGKTAILRLNHSDRRVGTRQTQTKTVCVSRRASSGRSSLELRRTARIEFRCTNEINTPIHLASQKSASPQLTDGGLTAYSQDEDQKKDDYELLRSICILEVYSLNAVTANHIEDIRKSKKIYNQGPKPPCT